jgi:hypothetical protein
MSAATRTTGRITRSRRNAIPRPQPEIEIRKATPQEVKTWEKAINEYTRVFLPVILRKVFDANLPKV